MLILHPSVGENVRLLAPKWLHNTIRLRFTATLSSEDYYRDIIATGAKLQLWSDLPGGHEGVSWGSFDFEPVVPVNAGYTNVISLYPGPDTGENPDITALGLIVSVPYSLISHTFFFTYRIVYPSGVQWLGDFGQNGSIHLEPSNALVQFGDQWEHHPNLNHSRWNSHGRLVEDIEACHLTRPSDWVAYGMAYEKFLGEPQDCSVIFCIPVQSTSVIIRPTLVFTATPDTTASLTHHGKFSVTGSGSFSLHIYDEGTSIEEFVHTIFRQYKPPLTRLLKVAQGHIVLASLTTSYPVKVAAIPITSVALTSTIPETIDILRSLFGPDDTSSAVSIYTPESPSVYFFGATSEETIAFKVPRSGGYFNCSLVHELLPNYAISILSPHTKAVVAQGASEAGALPTPPPSPPRSVLSYDVVVRSFSDLGIPSAEVESESDDSSVVTAPRPPVHSGFISKVRAFFLRIFTFGFFATGLRWIFPKSLFSQADVEDDVEETLSQTEDVTITERTPLLGNVATSSEAPVEEDEEEGNSQSSSSFSEQSVDGRESQPSLMIELVHGPEMMYIVKAEETQKVVAKVDGQVVSPKSVTRLSQGVDLVVVDLGGKTKTASIRVES